MTSILHTPKTWIWLVSIVAACVGVAACGKAGKAKNLNNQGNDKIELGHFEEAIADYDQAIQLQPDDDDDYANRGIAKAKLGHFEEALADSKAAMALAQEAGDSEVITFLEEFIQRLEQDVSTLESNR